MSRIRVVEPIEAREHVSAIRLPALKTVLLAQHAAFEQTADVLSQAIGLILNDQLLNAARESGLTHSDGRIEDLFAVYRRFTDLITEVRQNFAKLVPYVNFEHMKRFLLTDVDLSLKNPRECLDACLSIMSSCFHRTDFERAMLRKSGRLDQVSKELQFGLSVEGIRKLVATELAISLIASEASRACRVSDDILLVCERSKSDFYDSTLLERLADITAKLERAPSDPAIKDDGAVIAKHSAAFFEHLLELGAKIVTARGENIVYGYGIYFEPKTVSHFKPEVTERYDSFGKVAYLHFILLDPDMPQELRSLAHKSILSSVILQLQRTGANLLVGRIFKDNYLSFFTNVFHQPAFLGPDCGSVRSETGEEALFVGVAIEVTPSKRAAVNRPSPAHEAEEIASGVAKQRMKGFFPPTDLSSFEVIFKIQEQIAHYTSVLERRDQSQTTSLTGRQQSRAERKLKKLEGMLLEELQVYTSYLTRQEFHEVFAQSSAATAEAVFKNFLSTRVEPIPTDDKISSPLDLYDRTRIQWLKLALKQLGYKLEPPEDGSQPK